MTITEARELFAYGRWANTRMFDAAGELSETQFGTTIASSFSSVGATLAHIVSSEWVWMRRWLGESPTATPAWVNRPNLAELKDQLTAVEAERDGFLAGLSDADLGRVISHRNLAGQPCADPLGEIVRHLVNHGTYHRGQLATQLRQLGVKPPATDYIAFVRERSRG